jgi:hypothetical protein
VRAEVAKGNNKRGESPLSSSDPAGNDDNKDKNALSALTNAEDIDEEEEEEGETTEGRRDAQSRRRRTTCRVRRRR